MTYRIEITRDNKVTNRAEFETEQECLNWLESLTPTGAFGKPEKTIRVPYVNSELDPMYTIPEGYDSFEDITDSSSNPVYRVYHYPANFTYEITNIDDEIAWRNTQQFAKQIKQRCDNALEYIVAYNTQKIAEGSLTSNDIDTLESLFAGVLQKLHNYRPDKAIELIQALDLTNTVYTEEARTKIIGLLS